jgi:hypothetical protein
MKLLNSIANGRVLHGQSWVSLASVSCLPGRDCVRGQEQPCLALVLQWLSSLSVLLHCECRGASSVSNAPARGQSSEAVMEEGRIAQATSLYHKRTCLFADSWTSQESKTRRTKYGFKLLCITLKKVSHAAYSDWTSDEYSTESCWGTVVPKNSLQLQIQEQPTE